MNDDYRFKVDIDGTDGTEIPDVDEYQLPNIQRRESKAAKTEEGEEEAVVRKPRRRQMSLLLSVLILIGVFLMTTVLAAVFLKQVADRKISEAEEEETHDELVAEGTAQPVIPDKLFTEEEVEKMLEEARAEAAAEAREAQREELRLQLGTSGNGVYDVLRHFFPDHIFFQTRDGLAFFPIDTTREASAIREEAVTVSENGLFHYVIDGEEAAELVPDVSQFQGEIDWQAVADYGIGKAIIRAGFRGYGSGALVTDNCYEANMQGALAAGLDVGVYFVTQAITVEEAHEEAAMVLQLIAPYEVKLPVAIDVERITNDTARTDNLSMTDRTAIVRAFLDDIEAAGYEGMIYGNMYSFFAMIDIDEFREDAVWCAFYNSYPYYPYAQRCWQYSDTGRLPGISTDVDLNLWFE